MTIEMGLITLLYIATMYMTVITSIRVIDSWISRKYDDICGQTLVVCTGWAIIIVMGY